MSDTKQVVHAGGVGIGGLLFVAFVVLQLTGHIDWAWYWIASPLWVPFAAMLAIMLLFFAIAVPVLWVAEKISRRRGRSRRAKWEADRRARPGD